MRFRSTYLATDGGTATAVLEAADVQALHEQLHGQGCLLLRARPLADVAAERPLRLPSRRLLAFVQSLQAALDAGVPLLSVLQAMREQETDGGVAAMIADLGERIGNGQTLADAMAGWPRTFAPVLRAMVHAGEQSGTLPAVLRSVAGFLEWRLGIAATVRQALIYPLVIAAAGYGLLLLMLGFVLPRLAAMLERMTAELPPASRLLLRGSQLVAGHLPEVVAGSAALVLLAVLGLRGRAGRAAAAGLLLRLPVAGGVARTLAAAQLCRSLAVLLRAGITVPYALQLAGLAIAQRRLQQGVLAARDAVLAGDKITDSLAAIGLLPPVALSMVRVGEDSGRLPDALEQLSAVYDRDAKDAVRRALALLEPMFTVALGLVVGGVAVLVITTIYSAMRGIGR